MSDLQQATVKLVLNALHSTHITIESFIMMAISVENLLSRSLLNGGIEMLLDTLCQNVLISHCVKLGNSAGNENIQGINVKPYFQGEWIPFPDCKNDPRTTVEFRY